jgi:hypothetical protein
MTPVEVVFTIALRTVDGDAEVLVCRYSAATPAACGLAIEVPLIVLVAVLLVCHAKVMLDPGAKMSRQLPQLENDDLESEEVVEPTVMAAATRAGEELHALTLSFPAATEYETPSVIELFTALSNEVLAPPPRLMFATAGGPGA